LESEVSQLLEENNSLVKGFQVMCRDLQKLYQRLKALNSMGNGLAIKPQPLKSQRQQENDRNGVNRPEARDNTKAWADTAMTVSSYSSQPITSSSKFSLGAKPIANLEKISEDLQNIAKRLQNLNKS